MVFQIIAEPQRIEWQLFDLLQYDPIMIENTIRAGYPDAQIERGSPNFARPDFKPTYRYVGKYQYITPEFVAPILMASDITDSDPLAIITQAMSDLQPRERITYTIIVVGIADFAYKEGEKLITRNVYDGSLGGLLFPAKAEKYIPQVQRIAQEKLQTELYQCLAFLQFETPVRQRLEYMRSIGSHMVLFDRPQFNGLRWYSEDFNKNVTYVDTDEHDTYSSAIGLYLSLLGAKQNPPTPALKKTGQAIRLILEPREIAALWHLPHQDFQAPTIAWAQGKTVAMPRQLIGKRQGAYLGENVTARGGELVYISDADRATHMTIIGKTGTGKSTLLHHLIHQDILHNRGVALIDPHGDLVQAILQTSIPPSREGDVVLLDMADETNPPPLNPFAIPKGGELLTTAGQLVTLIELLFGRLSDTPRVADTLTMALVTLWYADTPTLLDVERLFDDLPYRQELIRKANNLAVTRFWDKFDLQSDAQQQQLTYPVIYRLRSLYGNPALLPILCHPDTLDFASLMAQRKILLISLAADERKIPLREQEFLGATLVSTIQTSAATFERLSPAFNLYIDEAQRFVTTPLPQLFESARKRGLALTLANQYFKQLAGDTLSAVLGNVGAIVAFQCGHEDARLLSAYMQPNIDSEDLINLDRYQAAVWMRDGGQTLPAFTITTRLPLVEENHKHVTQREYYLRVRSVRDYTPKTRQDVLEWINQRYMPAEKRKNDDQSDSEFYDPLQ